MPLKVSFSVFLISLLVFFIYCPSPYTDPPVRTHISGIVTDAYSYSNSDYFVINGITYKREEDMKITQSSQEVINIVVGKQTTVDNTYADFKGQGVFYFSVLTILILSFVFTLAIILPDNFLC